MWTIFSNWRVLGVLFFVASTTIGVFYYGQRQYAAGYSKSSLEWQAKTNQIKAESATKLAQEVQRVREVEQEAQRAANTATSGLLASNRSILHARDSAIAALNQRLRDNSTRCGAGSGSPPAQDNGTGAVETAASGIWVSGESAESLINLAVEADQLHAQYVAIQSYLKDIGM